MSDILVWLDRYAPFRYMASWDHSGLQVGDSRAPVERVLVALDPSSKILQEAEYHRCQCLITHHPLIFRSLSAVCMDQFPGNLIIKAISLGIHLVAAHTNLDAARDGTNDRLAHLLSLENVEALEMDKAFGEEARYGGMGRIGYLPAPLPLEELVRDTQRALECRGIRVVGSPKKRVHRIALCTGSGGSLVEQVILAGCDAYVTGDVKYHEAQRALEADLAIIDVGHFASERIIVQPLVEYLQSCAAREQLPLEVLAARDEDDPFRPYGGECRNV